MTAGTGKHLDKSKRVVIQNALENNKTAKEIGMLVGLDPTNISREVKKRRRLKEKASKDKSFCSKCANKIACHKHNACNRTTCNLKCVGCFHMYKCNSYEEFLCDKTNRFPFVCNGCSKKDLCPLDQYFYYGLIAESSYRKVLIESRKGINQTPDDFKKINDALIEGVAKGQSIYHIANSIDDVDVSTSTLYRYIHNDYVTIQVHDLPKTVTLKKRKKKIPSEYEYLENKGLDRTGHLYKDWIIYQVKNRIIMYWEMDFLGVPHCSKKMILAFTIPKISFILLYIIEHPDNDKVLKIIDEIEESLGTQTFNKIFEAVVTDRDCKFNDISRFEHNKNKEKRTSLFFCDSGMSNQKPNIENINSQLRLFIDKKADISDVTQEQCYELASHLNSRLLYSLGASSPCDAFVEFYGEDTLSKLHLRKIEPKNVAPKNIINKK